MILLFVSRKGRPLDDTAVARVHHALGDYRDRDNRKITTHGFRSTFRDWAGDCTAFPEEICQFALAHVKGDQAEAAYRRSTALEKRRELMKAWADYCDQIRPANVANVVLIRAAV
jgi:integrase